MRTEVTFLTYGHMKQLPTCAFLQSPKASLDIGLDQKSCPWKAWALVSNTPEVAKAQVLF